METALDIIARIGTDTPPTLSELTEARDTIARELHALKGAANVDLEALVSLRETYTVVSDAITEVEATEAKAAEDVEGILDGIPDPDAELSSKTEEPPAAGGESTKVLPLREAVARLGLTPKIEVVGEREPEADKPIHTLRVAGEKVDDISWADLGQQFSESAQGGKQGRERVLRVSTEFPEGGMLSGRKDENTSLIDSFVSPEAVKAAGGCCSLPTPIYDNPIQGSTDRPIRDSLPSIGAPRGKVVFFPAVCIPHAGSGVWTCEDDAAVDPDDSSTWKDCTAIECAEEDGAEVEAIYRCLTVGDYTARFASEEWQARVKAVAITQARAAEVNLFSKMRAAVTSTHTGLATGSTYLNIVNTAIRAANLIRQDQRFADVQFDLTAPAWLMGAATEGFGLNRLDKGGDLEDVQARIASALGNENIRPVWSWDIDDLESFQYDGALADYPSTASTVLAPSGYFTFLDGGQFDLGTEIRDFDQARQNVLGAFAESYEGLLSRGCNAKALDIPVECDLSLACPS